MDLKVLVKLFQKLAGVWGQRHHKKLAGIKRKPVIFTVFAVRSFAKTVKITENLHKINILNAFGD